METLKKKGYIFASIFTLSNRLQVIGDKFDKDLTVKQWLLLAGILNSGKKAPTLTEVAAIIGSSRQNVKGDRILRAIIHRLRYTNARRIVQGYIGTREEHRGNG